MRGLPSPHFSEMVNPSSLFVLDKESKGDKGRNWFGLQIKIGFSNLIVLLSRTISYNSYEKARRTMGARVSD